MITLVLESSTYAGSVALLDGDDLRGDRSVAMRGREHEALMPAVAELLASCDVPVSQVEQVVCGAGPGAFTSLRVAGSIAKGIAMASGARLIPVSSLALLVASLEPLRPGRFLATMDAMRREQYLQLYEIDSTLTISALTPCHIVPVAVLGEAATRSNSEVIGPQQSGVAAITPHARAAVRLTKMISATGPADLAAWEPGYGRLAEAQVKWEAEHGRPLVAG